ncbi:winged helix-turn-helix domain-containing protein [bacterium M00.F.Ca.ET.228.01.1.1]|uniref:winged helix-turn-helix domain-containing protein n=1 Tax=Paraburkholderia phenoliruptrix TaxID=252970 RepID=UPI0010923BF2|nr:YcaQ family DNA glycosylase [Paraburkholderia phenoliruptrix]MBW9100063.1 YcaQ family DNA glycosylase [Paraburkholderia phenoliruptrix]TGP40493.1 winged helix-turn-helix domain-containing protein [bacterium M00.F.Ca.ET.228.01.1.1]TGR96763.1 winged helix-turn-helix domain-containing protein [bacterium M00.F.Ca.ET.191.01.1.1]TGT98030.1 winged helix-turn-helix domain-containing protein [bacterium M00.F.Ca.ET.155.01.1.1]
MKTLSLSAARTLHLAAQGLLSPPRRKATKADVLEAIRRMAQLQIDTIHVVARSPYLVLFSRLGAYPQHWLDEHLAEGKLFEYWSHEACFVPIEDYGLLRHRMLDPSGMGWKYAADWHARHRGEIDRLLERIRASGPVRSADFARESGKGNGWWDWKPEKRHLEVLFAIGQLMVTERRNFQRVYDLTERVLPDWSDARDLPPAHVVSGELLRRTCRALGVVRADWVADYYRLPRRPYHADLRALADQGVLIAVQVPGWKQDTFVHRDLAPLVDDAASGKLASTVTTVLSPFDPVVWDRKRAAALFDFDYAIECYTPAAKRKYGYFVLPLLSRGRLVGRVDAKAHRAQGVFELKAVHMEAGVRPSARLAGDLRRALQRCADWHGTAQLQITSAVPEWMEALGGNADLSARASADADVDASADV